MSCSENKYLVMTEISEYSNAYTIYEFDNLYDALECYQEKGSCYYLHQLKIYKCKELEMTFEER